MRGVLTNAAAALTEALPTAPPPSAVPFCESGMGWARPRPLWVRKAAPVERSKKRSDFSIFVQSHHRPQQAQAPTTREPLVTHIYPQGSASLESACCPRARCIRCQQPKLPFADPAAESPGAFFRGPAKLCACCSTPGMGDGYKCSQKSGP